MGSAASQEPAAAGQQQPCAPAPPAADPPSQPQPQAAVTAGVQASAGAVEPLDRLQHRAAVARHVRVDGGVVKPGWAARNFPHQFVEPRTAVAFLKAFDGGEGAKLRKPDAFQPILLGEALTTVNGATWTRQRPAFLAAAGGGPSQQQARHAKALRMAAEFALTVPTAQAAYEDSTAMCVPDAARFAQLLATRGLVSAVLGCEEAGEGPGA
jgi:hypothetical protein